MKTENTNPWDEYVLRLEGRSKLEAVLILNEWITENYGFLFDMEVNKILLPIPDGRWEVEFKIRKQNISDLFSKLGERVDKMFEQREKQA